MLPRSAGHCFGFGARPRRRPRRRGRGAVRGPASSNGSARRSSRAGSTIAEAGTAMAPARRRKSSTASSSQRGESGRRRSARGWPTRGVAEPHGQFIRDQGGSSPGMPVSASTAERWRRSVLGRSTASTAASRPARHQYWFEAEGAGEFDRSRETGVHVPVLDLRDVALRQPDAASKLPLREGPFDARSPELIVPPMGGGGALPSCRDRLWALGRRRYIIVDGCRACICDRVSNGV